MLIPSRLSRAAITVATALAFSGVRADTVILPTSPLVDSPTTGLFPDFLWDTEPAVTAEQSPRFQIQLARDPGFDSLVIDDVTPLARYVPARQRLQPGSSYFWRVRRLDQQPVSDWSEPAAFTVADFSRTVIEIDADDTVADVRAAFARAAAAAPATVRLTEDVQWGIDEDDPLVSLVGATDIWFDGNNKSITVTHPYNRVFQTTDCHNVLFTDLSVDFDPLPYVLCEVTAVDLATDQLTVRTVRDPANPSLELDDPIMLAAQKTHMRLLDRDRPGRIKPGTDTYIHDGKQVYSHSYDTTDGRRHVLRFDPAEYPLGEIEIGDLMLRVGRGNGRNFLRAATSTHITVDRVEVGSSASQFASSIDGSGLIVINSRVAPAPGRYCSITADSIYVRRNPIGPWIENCEFIANGDDGINLHSFGSTLAPAHDDRSVKLTVEGDIQLYDVGDEVMLWAGVPTAAPPVFTTVTGHNPRTNTLSLAAPVKTQLAAEPHLRLYNRSRHNARFAILRTRITDNARHGIMVSATNGVIAHNRFQGCASTAIQLGNNPPEGGGASHILVANNHIANCGYSRDHIADHAAMITLATYARPWVHMPPRLISDIVIGHNHIAHSTGPAFLLSGVSRIHISDTHYIPPADGEATEFARIDHADAVLMRSSELRETSIDMLPVSTGPDTRDVRVDPPRNFRALNPR